MEEIMRKLAEARLKIRFRQRRVASRKIQCFGLCLLMAVGHIGILAYGEERRQMACIIPSRSETSYWSEVEQAVERTAEEQNVDMSVIYTEGKGNGISIGINDALEIAELIDSEAVILSYSDADEETDEILRRMREEGIRIIFIDNDAEESLRDVYVGIDNVEAGYQLGTYICEQLKEDEMAVLIIMQNYLEKENFRQRMAGILQAFEDCPEKLYEYQISSDSSINYVIEIGEELRTLDSPGALICCNEMMTRVGPQIRDSDEILEDMQIYGFDLSEKTKELLEEGKVQMIVNQNPASMGTVCVNTAIALLDGTWDTSLDMASVEFDLIRRGGRE